MPIESPKRMLQRKFDRICREAGGNPQFKEYENGTLYASFRCNSAREFPDPKRFIELMKEASDLSEMISDSNVLRFSFHVGTHVLGAHITGEIRFLPEGTKQIIWFHKNVPYGYKDRISEVSDELNVLLDRELRKEEGWKHYCFYRVMSEPPYSVSLSCDLLHEGENPDFDRISRIMERLKEVSEREPKLLEVSGRTVLVE